FVPDTNKELEAYAGQFQTLANFEVIQPTGNWMISDGYTFFLGPYTHTGVRMHYAPNATTNLYLGVNNGWNGNMQSNQGSYFPGYRAWSGGQPHLLAQHQLLGISGPSGEKRLF
ncbi:hypothetical protein B1B_04634, partial [mine drainage metagenome]